MSSHDTHPKLPTDFYDDDSNRNKPRPSTERLEGVDQDTPSDIFNPGYRNQEDSQAYRQVPALDIDTPSQEETDTTREKSRLQAIWESKIIRGATVGIAAVAAAGAIFFHDAGASEDTRDPAQHESDRATVETQPQDETTTEETNPSPLPSESATETSTQPAEENEQPNTEIGVIGLEGVNSKEDIAQAVVEFMSNHMMAGATTANFEAWKASGEDVDTFSTNLAHEIRQEVEATYPGLSGSSFSYLDQAEVLNATALKQFFQSKDAGVRPFDATFIYKGVESIDNIDRGPILATTVTMTLEINGIIVVDTDDKPIEYTFKTNARGVDENNETIYNIEDNTEDGSLTIDNINPGSLPGASTLTRGA